jgi:hypothetical protein
LIWVMSKSLSSWPLGLPDSSMKTGMIVVYSFPCSGQLSSQARWKAVFFDVFLEYKRCLCYNIRGIAPDPNGGVTAAFPLAGIGREFFLFHGRRPDPHSYFSMADQSSIPVAMLLLLHGSIDNAGDVIGKLNQIVAV